MKYKSLFEEMIRYIYEPRKCRKMTFACSSEVSYVPTENVVHSIDLSKSSSISVGGGCIAIIEGSGPSGRGKCFCGE
jgi:hypothetical protein